MEEMITIPLAIQAPDTPPLHLNVGGIADRIDIVRDSQGTEYLRVLDYKTGAKQEKAKTLQDLFADENHSKYHLQALLYAICARHTRHYQGPVKPILFYASHASRPDYDPTLHLGTAANATPIEDIAPLETEYLEHLTQKLQQLFDPSQPFTKTPDTTICEYCEYKDLCK